MCESFNFPLREKKHNKLWFFSKQTNCFPYVSKRKLLFCYSACSTDDSSGEILGSSTFSHVAGKMRFPTHSLYALIIGFEAPTPTLLLKGSQRTRSSRVWFLQALRATGGGAQQGWPYGLEIDGVPCSCPHPQSSWGWGAMHSAERWSRNNFCNVAFWTLAPGTPVAPLANLGSGARRRGPSHPC